MRAKFQKLKEGLASYKYLLELSFTPQNNLVVTYRLDSGKEVTASGQLDSRKSMELLLQFFLIRYSLFLKTTRVMKQLLITKWLLCGKSGLMKTLKKFH